MRLIDTPKACKTKEVRILKRIRIIEVFLNKRKSNAPTFYSNVKKHEAPQGNNDLNFRLSRDNVCASLRTKSKFWQSFSSREVYMRKYFKDLNDWPHGKQ